ncbi:MAG: Gfo/Idh/MocA family protein [Fimbriimonas sp.]
MSTDIIRSAVIGYGGAFNMGKMHADQMIAAGMPFVAACDVDASRMVQATQDFPGIRTYTSVDDLAADPDVDLVVVILPHNLHASVSIQLLNAGKHVVVEKPFCITLEEADAMIEASERNGKMLSVFHNRRHDGDYLAIKEAIDGGLIGELFHIEACMGGYDKPGTWWRSDKAISGGAMYDWGAHIIDWVLQIIPEEIAGVDGYYHKRHWTHTNEDHTELIIRFKSGKTAQVEISSLAAIGKDRWRFLGTLGAIRGFNWDKLEAVVDHNGRNAKIELRAKETNWQAFYNNIAGHLMRGEDLEVKATQARRTIGVIEAAEQSSAAQKTFVPRYV